MSSIPPFTFAHPARIVLVGPSGCGKTEFLVRALDLGLFYPKPTRIVWVYGESQPAHLRVDELVEQGKLPKVEYLRNETNYADLVEGFDPSENNLLVLDDQMSEAKGNIEEFGTVFTKGSHHRNFTVVFLTQNVFEKSFRTSNVNTQYNVLFNNPRDQLQPAMIARQMFPGMKDFFRDVYQDATQYPYSYLVLDAHNASPNELRLLTNVGATSAIVYVSPKFADTNLA